MKMLPVLTLLGILLFAQGCATKPEIVEKPVFVNVPVAVHCVDSIPDEPKYATKSLTPDSDLPEVADAYMVETAQKDIHITQLEALLKGCVKQ